VGHAVFMVLNRGLVTSWLFAGPWNTASSHICGGLFEADPGGHSGVSGRMVDQNSLAAWKGLDSRFWEAWDW